MLSGIQVQLLSLWMGKLQMLQNSSLGLLDETVQKRLGREDTFSGLWPQDIISVQRAEKIQLRGKPRAS